MKQQCKLLVIICLMAFTTNAQEKLDCDFNFKEALFYLKGDEYINKDINKSKEYLKPCIAIGNANAQLLMGRIYLSEEDEDKYREAFKLIKASAKQGNAIAATDLGILYKNGKGCKLNYNKARKWLKKGHDLGNNKATYSLGYLYLKGFGNINQDYKKAVKWFKKSNYSMAKYWLGICYYHGYGVKKNIVKAKELLNIDLNETSIKNSNNSIVKNETKPSVKNIEFEEILTPSNQRISNEELAGTWLGELLLFDWSRKNIEQKIPLQIEFKYNTENEALETIWGIEGTTTNEKLVRFDNSLYFNDFITTLPHSSFRKSIPNKLEHEILSSNLSIKKLGAKKYLTGVIESYIKDWKEPGVPMRFVVTKKETFENTNKKLKDTALKALSQQENSFIKLYPNPFKTDLIIGYTLDKTTTTTIKIAAINGLNETLIKPTSIQHTGSYNYYYNGANLPKGLYVVTILTGREKNTKIIIKK
ncbi:conserved exported hypothetical protein [Tenacibaculum dicentrarchi]|nr:conserved exported hypothetical protein [Tenacibaculum dicentrarchi]